MSETAPLSDDEALARLDASEDLPFVSQEELDSLPARGSVKPPDENQVHPRDLFSEAPELSPKPELSPEPELSPAPEPTREEPDAAWASTVESANTLLGKMQVPASVRDKLDEKARVAWAEQLKPVYDQNSNAYRELAELKKKVNGLQQSQPQRPPASESVSAEPADYPDEVNLDELTEGFAGEFGEDAAKAFRRPIEVMMNQNKALADTLNGMQGLLRDSIVDGARRELRGEYPQLSDPQVFERVNDTAQVLVATGRYDKFDDAMRKAAQIELAEAIATSKAEERLLESQARDDAQVSVPQRVAPVATTPLTGEAAEDFVLALLDKGLTSDQARAELARRNRPT
jgi:hypothetical protein